MYLDAILEVAIGLVVVWFVISVAASQFQEFFADLLKDMGLEVTVRKSLGEDVAGACGQLAGQVQDKTRRTQRVVHIAQVHR